MTRLRSGWATDPGRVRSSNQDRVLVIEGRVFAVADGMGGHRGGEVAAQIVVEQLRRLAPGATPTISGGATGPGSADDDDPDTAVLEMPFADQSFPDQASPNQPVSDPFDGDAAKGSASDSGVGEGDGPETGNGGRPDEPALTTDRLVEVVQQANRVVLTRASHDRDLHGMGTTLTAIALVESPGAAGQGETLLAVVNVGDSRTYWMRQGHLEQLTEDHSIVAELIREGRLTPDEARLHRQRSVLTRALGVEPDVDVDVIEVIPTVGQRFVACSDGLYGEVPDEIIGAILRRLADPDEAARELVRTAIERGGRDNVSVIVVDVVDDDQLAERASAVVAGGGTEGRAASSSPVTPGDVATPSASRSAAAPPKVRRRDRPRTPWPINLRVLLFLAVIAGLVAVVAWVWQNAPDDENAVDTTVAETIATIPTTIPVTTVAGTTVDGAEQPTTSRVLSLPSTTVLLDLEPTIVATTVDGAAPTIAPPPPAPSTTLDPFGPEPSTTTAG